MSAPDLPRSAAKPGVSPYVIAALVSFGTLVEALDSTALAVALNTVAGNLGAGAEESDMVLTAYLVANAAIMPVSGWAAVYFGRKRYFIACVILFTVASMLCAMAWSIESLIVFRVLQGAAAAGNAASESSIIADSFPPEKRGQGFAIYGMAVVVGPTFGPMFGGWVTENFSWQWIFWSNVPVGVVAIICCFTLLRDTETVKAETRKLRAKGLRLDWLGLTLAVLGLAALEIFFDEGQPRDWFASALIRGSFVVALVCLIALPVRELMTRNPILDFRLYRNPNFAVSFTLLFVVGMVLFGGTTLYPLWLQQSFGYTASWAGLALGLGGAAVFLLMPAVGALSGKIPSGWMIGPGLVTVAVGLFFTSRMYPDYSFLQVSLIRVGQTIGLALLFVPIQSQAYVGVPGDRSEQVGAFLNLARNLGGSVGTALGTTWLERGRQSFRDTLTDSANPYRDEYRAALEQYGSLEAFNRVIDQQATVLAYQSAFFTLFVLCVCCVPLVFLLRGKAAMAAG